MAQYDQEFGVVEALLSLTPNARFTVTDEVITVWDSDNSDSQPTQSAIDAKITELQNNYNAKEYQRKRRLKYDALNQFELISDDAINGTTTHKDAILAIKAEFPKP